MAKSCSDIAALAAGRGMALGPWVIDPVARTLSDGAETRTLSLRAMRVLLALIEAEGAVVSREMLMQAAWPEVTVGDESLTQAISEIRRRLGDDRAARRYVATVSKAGYRILPSALEGWRRHPVGGLPVGGLDDAPSSVEEEALLPVEAYCRVLETRDALDRGRGAAIADALSLADEAVRLAPRSSLPHAQAAIIYAHRGLYGGGGRGDLICALRHAETAVGLNPRLSTAQAAIGFALGALGRWDAAQDAYARALAHGSADPVAHYLAARTAYAAGRFRSAATLAGRAASIASVGVRSHFLAARAAASFDLALARRHARACDMETRDRLATDPGEPRGRSALGPIAALLGDPKGAREAIASSTAAGTICRIHDVLGYALIGEVDSAFEALEASLDEGYRDGAWLLRDPILERARGDRRFARLTRAIA